MTQQTQPIREFFTTEKEPVNGLNENPSHAMTEEEMLRIFVGPNSDKFIALHNNTNVKWTTRVNLVFLFFPFAWLFYRKLYLTGIGMLVIPIILAHYFPAVIDAFYLPIQCSLSVSMNVIYKELALRQIRKQKEQGWSDEELKKRLASKGGTSRVGGIFGAVLMACLVGLQLFLLNTP